MRTITILTAPATVLLTILLGWLLLTSFGWPLHTREMTAAAIVNTAGGMLAALPLCLMMHHGVLAIMRAWTIGQAVRIGVIFFGILLASGSGWGMAKMPLIYWALACYFPLLAAETATAVWLSRKANK